MVSSGNPTRMVVTLRERRGWRGWKTLRVVYCEGGEEAERVARALAILHGKIEDREITKGDSAGTEVLQR